ncbi:MAG: 4'-phosphopantetheinyl transferase [Isosphaera sp.]|nr:4'-phosphopantetheinyl transferase [Isosphaera sp.]
MMSAGREPETARPDPPRVVVASLADPAAVRPGEVRVWVVPLAAADPADVLDLLTPDERARADRYKVGKARHEFVVGRGHLRRLLGELLGVEPAAVPITTAGAGKPVLAGGGVHFNVTHTDGLALVALADRPVGVDVERVRPVANPDGLVDRFFSPAERRAYRDLPPDLRPAGFFRGWTTKEAVLKAAGLGVMRLDDFDVELDPGRPPAVLAARDPALAGGWGLSAWPPADGYAAAVAVRSVSPPSEPDA